jgi:RNase P subunit RPR2
MSHAGKRTTELTEAERDLVRREWAAAEERAKAKKRPPSTRAPRMVAVKPMFNQEHCEGCETMLPRGHTANVETPEGWKFLCSRCRREHVQSLIEERGDR